MLGFSDGLFLSVDVLSHLREFVQALGLVLSVHFNFQFVLLQLELCVRFELNQVCMLALDVVILAFKLGVIKSQLLILL